MVRRCSRLLTHRRGTMSTSCGGIQSISAAGVRAYEEMALHRLSAVPPRLRLYGFVVETKKPLDVFCVLPRIIHAKGLPIAGRPADSCLALVQGAAGVYFVNLLLS